MSWEDWAMAVGFTAWLAYRVLVTIAAYAERERRRKEWEASLADVVEGDHLP